MAADERGMTIEALAREVGLPVRTIRFYISEGLLPGPDGRGKAAVYGPEQLLRLRLIRRLSEQRVPLVEIRDRLARLDLVELRALLVEEQEHAAALARAERAPSPKEYVWALLERAREARRPVLRAAEAAPEVSERPPARAPAAQGDRRARASDAVVAGAEAGSRWRRLELAAGVELHVRAEAEDGHRDLIERVVRLAGGRLKQAGGPDSGTTRDRMEDET